MLGGSETKKPTETKPTEWSPEIQADLISTLANDAKVKFSNLENDVKQGKYRTTKLVWNVMQLLQAEIDRVAEHTTSPEAAKRLRERLGLGSDDTTSIPNLIKGYIQLKLKPQIDALEAYEKDLAILNNEAESPIADRINAANKAEPVEITADLATNLRTRPEQHEILKGVILKGVYPGTAETPTILVDDAAERGTELNDAYTRFRQLLDTESKQRGRMNKVLMTALANDLAIKLARERLPVDTSKGLDPEWKNKKITLQHLLGKQIGTPSAQSLFAGYLLERAQKDNLVAEFPIRIHRGVNETGAHAFVTFGNEIIDPSVSIEPLNNRKRPDEFYNVRS